MAQSTSFTAAGTILGTPYYTSPEQIDGSNVDASTDVWAVGEVLYQALTGTMPFDGPSPSMVRVSVLSKTPPPLGTLRPDLPPWLGDVVGKALERDRQKRWRSAREMAGALRAGLR